MILELKNGNCFAGVSTYGAELVSFKKGNKEYIWQGDAKYWKGQNPVLFPVLCSLKDDRATINGKSITLSKHGFARKSEFELAKSSENSITLVLRDNEKTRECYPFGFIFSVTHTLLDNAFVTAFSVENTSNEKIMFHVGGHTGINIPVCSIGDFSEHRIVFECVEYAVNYKAPTGGLIVNPEGSHDLLFGKDAIDLDYKMFDNDALMLADLKSENISLLGPDGHGVKMNIKDFSALGIWTPAGKRAPFICLEPWNGLPAFINESGRFEDKPFAISLGVGETYRAEYSLQII